MLRFGRIIFGLRPGAIDRGALEFSADMANLLGVALQGLFIEDEFLKELAASSRMREFHLLSREWRSIDAGRMAEDMQLAARSAEHFVQKIALERGIESLFDVLGSGSVAEFLRLTHPRDILVVSNPDNPQERLAPLSSFESFGRSSSTTMLLPRRIMRRKGPVIGLSSLAGDSTLRVAAAIAHAANERLLVVAPAKAPDYESILDAARVAGIEKNDVELLSLSRIDTQNFLAALDPLRERMIVLPRASDDTAKHIDPSMIVSMRSAPVIIVDPLAKFES
jgi:hypothetical protein